MGISSKKASFILSTVVAFILSILFTMAIYCGGALLGPLGKSAILDSIRSEEISQSIVDYTKEQGISLAIPMGLPESVFDNVFTKEETLAKVTEYVEKNLEQDDGSIEPETKDTQERLIKNINKYVKDEGFEITEEQEKNIEAFARNVMKDYAKNMQLPYFSYLIMARNLLQSICKVGLIVVAGLAFVAILILLKSYRWKHKSMRYITYSMIAALVMGSAPSLLILLNGAYRRIGITPEFMYKFAMRFVEESLSVFIVISCVMFVASIGMIVATYITRKKLIEREKRHSRHHHRSHSGHRGAASEE